MFKRQVTIFGRSIPVAAILLALVVVGAAAWLSIFLFQTRFAVSTTSALSAPVGFGSWSCVKKTGTGAVIDTCAERSGSNGPEIVVSGLSEDDLWVQAMRQYGNSNTVPITLTLVGAQNPLLPVTLETIAGVPLTSVTIAPSNTQDVFIGVRSLGIGPSQSLDVTGLEMQWAP